MAKAELTVKVNVKNLDRVRLLGWELTTLRDDMVVGASPFAERLDAILDRFVGEQDDDRPEDTDD
jgi:hypothetical protein